MIEFYFHYDSATHKGKLVTIKDKVTEEVLVDRIVCDVSIQTERKEVSPKFVCKGLCDTIIITENGSIAYIN